MNYGIYAFLYSTAVIGFFAISLLVGLRQKSLIYKRFALFALLLGTWQLLQFLSQFFSAGHWSVWLLKAAVVLAVPMGASFYLFAASYSEIKVRHAAYFYTLAFLVGDLALFSVSLSDATISRVGIAVSSFDTYYLVPMATVGVQVLGGVFLLIRNLRLTHGHERRKQDIMLLIAVVQALAIITFFSLTTPSSLSSQVSVPIATFLAALIISYAMIYHKLFDIRFVVLRAAAYLLVTFLLTIFFITPIVLTANHALDLQLSRTGVLASIAGLLTIIYLLQYVRYLFDRLTLRFFYRYYYDPQDVLDKIGKILVGTIDREVICAQSAKVLSDALRLTFVDFQLAPTISRKMSPLLRLLDETKTDVIVADQITGVDSQSQRLLDAMKSAGAAMAVKLRTGHDELGYLLVGYRQSGEAYMLRDEKLLSTVCAEVAVGLQNAMRFEEIEQFNEKLQERVATATKKLERTNAKLVQMDETKDEFISMASHQLRTPLTSVKGYISMVMEGDAGPISEQQHKMLDQAFVSSQRMVYLIADLLNVSRLKTGRFVIEPAEVNLAEVVAGEVSQLLETAQGRGLELRYEQPETFPLLMLDETKIRQVIMNFMDNAIYYTPTGGHILAQLKETDQSIEFTITDDGIGVPKHEQAHLFTKFFRAGNARKARPDGTGLGLFMAKKVIVAQGGALVFRSKEGKGSTFGFIFSKAKLAPPAKSAEPTV